MGLEGVVGGPQKRLVLGLAVLVAIDLVLGLFDADAHLERLGLHRDARPVKQFVRVAGTVSDRQNNHARGNRAAGSVHAADLPVGKIEPFKPASKPIFAPQCIDLAAKVPDQHGQPIAAQMRPVLIADRGLAAALDHLLEDPVHIRAAHPAGQLAIAERARAAFAKQVVVLAIERAAPVELADRGHALLHRLPSFQNEGAIPAHRKVIRGQQSGRSRTHDHRPIG